MALRLKSLELHGYKTFATRTTFEFASTVTAIVGPNGSGKSNIADSMRWVLGEQSYHLLRGKKTEDMIFSGSELRPRAGMASATIVFDNATGWLPIDYSEVAVTRRAYRDGQNEYLINGQRVRLKDVSELFAQSGLAERTYTIIGQGLVDAALALKAEERRRLFEEAAGIGLHRARREDALRRLEVTKRNLERVEDILAELQPRLKSLERQARRVQEFEQVTADLRVALRDWYGFHWHNTQKELGEAREAARVQEGILERLRGEQAVQDEQAGRQRDRLQSLRASLSSWRRQQVQLQNQREALNKAVAAAEERLHQLQGQQQASQLELDRRSQEHGLHQERLDAARQDCTRLESELEEAGLQAQTAQKNLAEMQARRQKAEQSAQQARQALAGLNGRQSQAQARLTERKAQAKRSQQAFESAQQAAAGAQKDLEAAEARAETARLAQAAADEQRQVAEAELESQRLSLARLESERKELQDQRSAAAAEAARLAAQLEVLLGAERALQGYASGTRLLLKAAQDRRIAGARGALSQLLETPPELELALSAALGEHLDAVILDKDPDEALDTLLAAATRGVLLPLGSLKPPPPFILEGERPGVIGLASELVNAPPELRPAVDLLLDWVVIVRDRKAGRALFNTLPEDYPPSDLARLRVVTLQGEILWASGLAAAGSSAGGGQGQPVLSRARLQRELAAQQISVGQAVQNSDARLGKLAVELKAAQAAGEQLAQQQRSARQKAEHAALAANQARLAVEQARKQANWQHEQQERLKAELERGEQESTSLAKDLLALEQAIEQAREQVRAQNQLLAGFVLDDLQSQLSHWITQKAVAGRALDDGRSRLRERQAMLEQSNHQQAALTARLEEISRELENIQAEKEQQRYGQANIALELQKIQTLIDPAEADLDETEQEQETLQKQAAALRLTLSNAEHHYSQARINLVRRQETLDSLRRRIEEDFGLVAFEFEADVTGQKTLPLEGMVEKLPRVLKLQPEVEDTIRRQRAQLRRIGPINPEAHAEYQEVKQRFTFLNEQVADSNKAEKDIRQVISELDELMQREFGKTFQAVAREFQAIFARLFGGGSARLVLTDPDDLTNTGIDIEARLPGRRTQGLSLLSGGERSLTAAALVFALLKVSPTPFCVLDEVDAMLDEANVGRYRELLRELSDTTQFVVVTHNRNTVQAADVIYGVTMGRDSASQVLSLRLDQVAEVVDE